MRIDLVVVGIGYVGLPLAHSAIRRAAMSVVGLDHSTEVVDLVNSGRSHVDDVSDDEVHAMLAHGFRATGDPAVVEAADAVVICVPTPLTTDRGPDLGPIVEATRAVSAGLRPGTLVVLESTTYPGTTEDVVRPLLESSGLAAGTDFALAYSPERIDPGNQEFGVHNIPKVVGGYTSTCAGRAADFYRRFISQVRTTRGIREAELAKLLENTYRHVNIALVNEMVQFCHELDIDLWDAIDAAATKPFGFHAFRPGPGVGGHCIPIDPNYLGHRVRQRLGYPFRFVELAQEVNSNMPGYVARRARALLADYGRPIRGASVLLLGVSYKPNVADRRESPAEPLARTLHDWGARVSYHDPHITDWQLPGVPLRPVPDPAEAVEEADLTVLLQNHRQYEPDRLADRARRFLDTRGATTAGTAQRL